MKSDAHTATPHAAGGASCAPPAPGSAPAWLDLVRKRVAALRYGTVQIVVHDGRVTEVDSTERTRLPGAARDP